MKKNNAKSPLKRKLLFVPFPVELESPSSLFKRAARENGCRRARLLADHFPAFNRDAACLSRDCPLAKFFASQAVDCSEQVLAAFYKTTGVRLYRPDLLIHGIRVKSVAIRYKSAAFCSDCYHEGRELFIKDLALTAACPTHQKKYISLCPACNRNLHWFEPLYQDCSCGQVLESEPCTASYVEPERFLLELWTTQNQSGFDQFFKTLKHLGFSFRNSASSYNRGILYAVTAITQRRWTALSSYARQLLDYHPQLGADLIKAKLSGIETLDKSAIDTIYTRALEIPSQPVAEHVEFQLSRIQVMHHLGLVPYQFAYLQQKNGFPKKPRRKNWYNQSDIESIAKLISWGIHTRWGLPITNKDSAITANDATAELNLSRHQLNIVLVHKCLISHKGKNGATLIEMKDVEKFKMNFVTIKSLATELELSPEQVRRRISKHHPHIASLGSHALDLMLTSLHCAATLKEETLHKGGVLRYRESALASWALRMNEMPRIEETAVCYEAARSAACRVGLDKGTIYEMVRAGIFRDVGVGPASEYMIPTDQVDDFWKTYISVTETAALLHCNKRSVASQLLLDGIRPAMGPIVQKGNTHLFFRADISNYIKTKDQTSPTEQLSDWMNLDEAAAHLKLTKSALRNILYSQRFRYLMQYVYARLYVSREFVVEFDTKYILAGEAASILNLSKDKVTGTLRQMGVLPLTGPSVDGRSTHVFLRCDVNIDNIKVPIDSHSSPSSHLNITHLEEKNDKNLVINPIPPKQPETHYIPVTSILEKYKLSSKAFTRIFLKHGFINALKYSGESFLTSTTAGQASDILDNYVTCAQADAMFEHKGHTRNLLKLNKLTSDEPIPHHLCDVTLIRKDKITAVLPSKKKRPNLP